MGAEALQYLSLRCRTAGPTTLRGGALTMRPLPKRQVAESSTSFGFAKTGHNKSFSAFVRNSCKRCQGKVLILCPVYLGVATSSWELWCWGSPPCLMHPSGSLVWRFSWHCIYSEMPFFLPALALYRQSKCIMLHVLGKGQKVKHWLYLCSGLAGVVCSC